MMQALPGLEKKNLPKWPITQNGELRVHLTRKASAIYKTLTLYLSVLRGGTR